MTPERYRALQLQTLSWEFRQQSHDEVAARLDAACRVKHIGFVDWQWLGSAVRLPNIDWTSMWWTCIPVGPRF